MITINKASCLDAPIKVDALNGVAFTKEQGAHKFIVSCYQNGEKLNLTGTITGKFTCNGRTIEIALDYAGIDTDGNAWVILSQHCYDYAGRFQLAIFNTVGDTTFCIYACVGNVQTSQIGDPVDGGEIIDSVETLIQEIDEAVRSIPPVYKDLVNKVEDLKNNIFNYNSINVLPRREDSSGTVGGNVNYTCTSGWLWTFAGNATSNVNRNLLAESSAVPDWFKPGNTLRIRLNKTGQTDAVRLVIYAYDGNNPTTADRYMQTFDDVDYIVPELLSKPGLMIRLYIASGSSVDGTVYPQIIYGMPNAEIVDSISEINTSLGNAETDIDNIQADVTDITNVIQTLQIDSLKYVKHPEETYPGKTLAEINDNIICHPSRSIYPSPDTAASGPYMILRYVNGYNLHLQVSNTTGKIFNRIVSRSNGSVYRDWVGVAVDSDLSNYLLQSVAMGRFDNKKIYCDGDSIMYGVTTYNGGVATQTVPQTIALRIPNATVDNKASGGDTIKHTGNISDSISDSLMADTTVKDYDYFVIDGGTNDYTQDVDLGMFEMAEFVGEFSTNTDYTIGQGVTYNNGLYYFTQDHDAGEWNDGHVGTVENYAGVFSPSVDYQAGQYVTYADPTYGSILKLFQFARQHNAGAWKDPYPNASPWAGNTTDVIAYDRTFYNGLHTMIRYIIQQTISNNKICGIMLITPIFRNYSHDLRGNAYNLPNRAGKTLSDYCDAMCNVGELYNIPVCDSRHLAPFNEMNYKQTLHLRAADSTGYLHPTDAGYKVWGQSIVSYFLSNF